MDNIELTPSQLLHKQAGQLAIILSLLEDDMRYKVELSIVAGDYVETFNILNNLKKTYVDGFRAGLIEDKDKLQVYPLMLTLDSYLHSIAFTHYTIKDLFIHKKENNFIYIQKILKKYGVASSELIAKEVYQELFINNNKKAEEYSRDSDDYLRDLQLAQQYAKKLKKGK